MERTELTKTFMMISNRIKPFGLHGLKKYISVLRVNPFTANLHHSRCYSALLADRITSIGNKIRANIIKVIYHPLYGMNNYVLIWGDWLSCDPLRGSHDS